MLMFLGSLSERRFWHGVSKTVFLLAGLFPAIANSAEPGTLLSLAQIASASDLADQIALLEPMALAGFDGFVSRDDDVLLVRHQSGGATRFLNRPECEDIEQEARCERYSLVARDSVSGATLVMHSYYQSAEYLLIDNATGGETVIPSLPLLSPSGLELAALNVLDWEIELTVQIYSRIGEGFSLQQVIAPFPSESSLSQTSYEFLGWSTDEAFAIEATASELPGADATTKRFVIYKENGVWQVTEP